MKNSLAPLGSKGDELTSPNIFQPRTNIRPYEYPDLLKYVDAIRHSYWVHTEYNFEPDVQNVKVDLKPYEAEAVNRTMLAISQIENKVKKFWARIDDFLPKPEIGDVGGTFSECEIRHQHAYAELINRLGLNERFEELNEVPAMKDRLAYISKVNSRLALAKDSPQYYFESIIFFSMLIENVSLFSQFYIILAFNRFKNVFKGMSNAVEATSKEEDIHAAFGFDLVNIIKEENPEWWTPDLIKRIEEIGLKAFEAEKKVLDWIYEEGDLEPCPQVVVEEFIKKRINDSLEAIGIDPLFDLDEELIEQTQWFTDEVTVTKNNDFFQKRGTTYTKRNKAITGEDLF